MFKWLNKEQKNELSQLPIFKNVEYFDIQVGWFEEIKKIGLEIQEYCGELLKHLLSECNKQFVACKK